MNCWRNKKLDKKPQPGFKEEINLENYQHLNLVFEVKTYIHKCSLTLLSMSCLNLRMSLCDHQVPLSLLQLMSV